MKKKIGLDDLLLHHSAEDVKGLPTIEVKKQTVEEMIEKATEVSDVDFIREIIKRIAAVNHQSEKSIYINKLSKKTGISKQAIKKDIKAIIENQKTHEVRDDNIIIVHPSLEIKDSVLVLGFRKTVILDNAPTEKNVFLITDGKYYLLHDESIYKDGNTSLVFDLRERHLIGINDKWNEKQIKHFLENIKAPEGVYSEIKSELKKYIEFQKEGHYGLVAAWIIATYFYRCFHAIVFLFFFGKKQSGKSRVLDFLERLAFNSIKTKGVSLASLADTIDGLRGAFLIDQAESLSDPKNMDILGIMADSYTIGGGKRRVVFITKTSRRVLEFETYSPKAFASFKEIDPDLKDRCVLISMLRATKDYPYPEAHLPIWSDLRDKLYKLLLTKWKKVKEIYPTTGEGVTQRVRELWRPIETILTLENVSADEVKDIKNVFLESMLETQTELSEEEHNLFDALLEMLEETVNGEGIFTVSEIAEKIEHDDDISEKGHQTWVGRTIRQFNLYDKAAGRKNKKRAYLFSYVRVKDIFNRYYTTGDTGGQVVNSDINQSVTGDHLEKTGGNCSTSGGNCSASKSGSTTSGQTIPPANNEVVYPNLLISEEDNHLTTNDTGLDEELIIEGEIE